jgi:hypothetical protein
MSGQRQRPLTIDICTRRKTRSASKPSLRQRRLLEFHTHGRPAGRGVHDIHGLCREGSKAKMYVHMHARTDPSLVHLCTSKKRPGCAHGQGRDADQMHLPHRMQVFTKLLQLQQLHVIKFHGVPRQRCLGSPKQSMLHQPCKCSYHNTMCRSTPTRRTTQAA